VSAQRPMPIMARRGDNTSSGPTKNKALQNKLRAANSG
jgi:hypothetical protein